MTIEPTTAEKMRKLRWNIIWNAFNSVYAQLTFFGSAFVLFLNYLDFSSTQIGFLLSMLPFFGIVALFIAPTVSRFGYKRTFVTFFAVRKLVTAGLLLVPWVLNHYGIEAVRLLITLVVMAFALSRAIGEVGLYPWTQEFIPNSIRGKHSAINDMVARATGIAAIAFAGFVLGLSDGIDRFIALYLIALLFGAVSVWSVAQLPGGAPTTTRTIRHSDLLKVARDRNFISYLLGLGLVTVASAPLSFLPLFMQNQVGLTDSQVVWLQIGTIAGGFSATYLFGWAADRYGSKPVMLSGLFVKMLLPLGWLLMPRNSSLSLPIALGIALIWGIAEIAWGIGQGRLFYVKVVPVERKTEYMAVFYAIAGVVGGTSQILSGWLLDQTADVSGQVLFVTIDQFTPLFVASLVLNGVGLFLFRNRVQADSDVSVGTFAGLFLHGNPLLAFESLMRYYRTKDERAAVAVTEHMGKTKSPLTVDEMLEALKDPRFGVRFEAIISIARMGSEPRLVEALCQLIDGTELSLSVIAAWALGRIGDKSALPSLRNGLHSPYRSIQAHCARSLGTLGDEESAPMLLERLRNETDKGLIIAYASAVGNLKVQEALDTLFDVLAVTENEGARLELALAIARIYGGEHHFIRLLRSLRQDPGTTASQVLTSWKRKLDKSTDGEFLELVDTCADQFARHNLGSASTQLNQIITYVDGVDQSLRAKLRSACAIQLNQHRAERMEYVLLALLALQLPEPR